MTQAQIEKDGEDDYVKICRNNAQLFGLPFSEQETRGTFRAAVREKREYDEAVELWKISYENHEREREAESKRLYEESKNR